MTPDHFREPIRWKSASPNGNSCVEVAHTLGGVRDSKNPDAELEVDVRMLVRMVKAESPKS
jgi:hypothetical protein